MSVPVRYYCPYCETLVTVERDAYLADKSVMPYPLSGWRYVGTADDVESADGVRFVCGDDEGFDGDGCGRAFYLNFVRFEQGREVDPQPVPDAQ